MGSDKVLVVNGATEMYWDNENARLGVGVAVPEYTLHVGGDIYAKGDVTAFSDRNYKRNIEPISDALSKLDAITGYTFEFDGAPQRHAGVLAQEVREVLPEVVREDSDGRLSVAYGNMVALLINAVKELRAEVAQLRAGTTP